MHSNRHDFMRMRKWLTRMPDANLATQLLITRSEMYTYTVTYGAVATVKTAGDGAIKSVFTSFAVDGSLRTLCTANACDR